MQKFEYPFEPYPNQLDFSEQLYKMIDLGSIGIFESPTGTVSIFCQLSNLISRENQWL